MNTKRPISPGGEELLDLYFPVLDHGFVALKDYFGNDDSIAEAARTSYGGGTKSSSDNNNLIRYLINHKHTSPVEQVEIKLHCRMPIFIARQWIRHRTANVNEISGRYSVIPMEFYTPNQENICYQSTNNKQGRGDSVSRNIANEFRFDLMHSRRIVSAGYKTAIENNIARETARIDLPLSTYTEWYWKIDIHNLLHFLTLRCDSHAQKEIRDYGNVIAGMIKLIYPNTYQAWIDYQFGARTFSRMECKLLYDRIK